MDSQSLTYLIKHRSRNILIVRLFFLHLCLLNMAGNCVQVADDEIYLVVNAGCREKDLTHISKHLDSYKVTLQVLSQSHT